MAAAAAPAPAPALAPKVDFSYLWGDERLADLTIRVKIKPAKRAAEEKEQARQEEPPAKRPRRRAAARAASSDDAKGTSSEANDEDAGVVATMRVHGVVLTQRSSYFKGLLLGGGADMVESQSKSLTVEMADEQGGSVLAVLVCRSTSESIIVLTDGPNQTPIPSHHTTPHKPQTRPTSSASSSSPTWRRTQEDGQRLSKEELVRLLVVANGYEMVWCVEECARALAPFEGFDDAVTYFQCVPDSLLYTEPLRLTTRAAGDALAVALGPAEQLWRPADTYSEFRVEDYLLDERVAALPIGGIEALLRSEELQLKSENITFSLALWWMMEQAGTQEELQPLFNRLLKSLRYARMSAVFLASIAQEEWAKDSGLLPAIMTCGLWRRDYPGESNESQDACISRQGARPQFLQHGL